MRGKESIIKKLFVIQLFSVSLLTLSAEPYKPYPILLIHGIASNSGTWGAPTILSSDSIPKDSIISGHTYGHFLDHLNPYVIAWDAIDESYTEDETDPAYPNKTFLEVINFDNSPDCRE